MTDQVNRKTMGLEIQVDEQTSLGQYVNMVVAQHSPSEFVVDFIFIPPGQQKAKVRSRIIISPEHAKRMYMLLGDNIKKFEERFGPIKLTEQPAGGQIPRFAAGSPMVKTYAWPESISPFKTRRRT